MLAWSPADMFWFRCSVTRRNGVWVQATSPRTMQHNGFCSDLSRVLESPMDVQFMGRAVPYAFKFNDVLRFELLSPGGAAVALCYCSKRGENSIPVSFIRLRPPGNHWAVALRVCISLIFMDCLVKNKLYMIRFEQGLKWHHAGLH